MGNMVVVGWDAIRYNTGTFQLEKYTETTAFSSYPSDGWLCIRIYGNPPYSSVWSGRDGYYFYKSKNVYHAGMYDITVGGVEVAYDASGNETLTPLSWTDVQAILASIPANVVKTGLSVLNSTYLEALAMMNRVGYPQYP